MPINYPDNVKHNNASFPIISASDNTVQGWYHVADTTERDALPSAKRLEGAVAVVGSTVYAYTSSDLGDTAWQTSGNWQNLGATGPTLSWESGAAYPDGASALYVVYGTTGDWEATRTFSSGTTTTGPGQTGAPPSTLPALKALTYS